MRIAIDARFASGKTAGVGRYTLNLISSLIRGLDKDELFIFCNETPNESAGDRINYLMTSITPEMHPAGELWQNIVLPLRLKKNHMDIFHSPAFFLPIFTPGSKKIVTIHDLAVFKFPQAFPCNFAKYLQFMVRLSTRVADRIIADSITVKNDLVDLLKIKKEKISVIHAGIDNVFAKQNINPPRPPLSRGGKERISNFKENRNLTKGFILYAGTIEPRKNLINLIRAFSIFKERGSKQKLVIAGKKGWLYEKSIEEAKNSRFADDIIFTEYIPDEELRLYYSACDVFVYPSIYEGFGLPPLEAMACGAPAVVSDIPVFREVLGEAAVFVDTGNPENIAEGIHKVLDGIKLRETIIAKGRERVKSYSWKKAAEETLKLYEEVLID
ncbi:MAG TPA: glycosyltransferase family 1 protein [bacterium]